jgi:hypothetical protein
MQPMCLCSTSLASGNDCCALLHGICCKYTLTIVDRSVFTLTRNVGVELDQLSYFKLKARQGSYEQSATLISACIQAHLNVMLFCVSLSVIIRESNSCRWWHKELHTLCISLCMISLCCFNTSASAWTLQTADVMWTCLDLVHSLEMHQAVRSPWLHRQQREVKVV